MPICCIFLLFLGKFSKEVFKEKETSFPKKNDESAQQSPEYCVFPCSSFKKWGKIFFRSFPKKRSHNGEKMRSTFENPYNTIVESAFWKPDKVKQRQKIQKECWKNSKNKSIEGNHFSFENAMSSSRDSVFVNGLPKQRPRVFPQKLFEVVEAGNATRSDERKLWKNLSEFLERGNCRSRKHSISSNIRYNNCLHTNVHKIFQKMLKRNIFCFLPSLNRRKSVFTSIPTTIFCSKCFECFLYEGKILRADVPKIIRETPSDNIPSMSETDRMPPPTSTGKDVFENLLNGVGVLGLRLLLHRDQQHEYHEQRRRMFL